MNRRHIQFIMLAFATLGSLLLFGSQVGATVLDAGGHLLAVPASKSQGAVPPPSAPNTGCIGGNYVFTQSTGATIVAGTTDIGNHGDDVATNVGLPFTYGLYDQDFNSVNASSNGNLQFANSNTQFNNACLPYATFNFAILPYWDDLTTSCTGCGIFTSTSGSAPNRIFNIEWRTQALNGGQTTNFEVRLYEGQSYFEIIYGTVGQSGSGATVGVQRDTGSRFTQFSCNTSSLSSGLKLTFNLVCPPTATPTRTITPGGPTLTPTRTYTPSATLTRTITRPPRPPADLPPGANRPLTLFRSTTMRWSLSAG